MASRNKIFSPELYSQIVDCISMSDEKMVFANNGVTMVLNVVDLYSKKAWSQPLKSKSAEEIKRGL